jgi:hypothetical protein
MNFGVIYTIKFYSINGARSLSQGYGDCEQFQINILKKYYSGEIFTMICPPDPIKIEYYYENKNTNIRGSDCELNIKLEYDGQYNEFISMLNQDYLLEIKRSLDGVTFSNYWKGFIDSDFVRQGQMGRGSVLTLHATCGLGEMKYKDFTLSDIPKTSLISYWTILENCFRIIFNDTILLIPFCIYIDYKKLNSEINILGDLFRDGRQFYMDNKPIYKVSEVLEIILKELNLKCYQEDGSWWIVDCDMSFNYTYEIELYDCNLNFIGTDQKDFVKYFSKNPWNFYWFMERSQNIETIKSWSGVDVQFSPVANDNILMTGDKSGSFYPFEFSSSDSLRFWTTVNPVATDDFKLSQGLDYIDGLLRTLKIWGWDSPDANYIESSESYYMRNDYESEIADLKGELSFKYRSYLNFSGGAIQFEIIGNCYSNTNVLQYTKYYNFDNALWEDNPVLSNIANANFTSKWQTYSEDVALLKTNQTGYYFKYKIRIHQANKPDNSGITHDWYYEIKEIVFKISFGDAVKNFNNENITGLDFTTKQEYNSMNKYRETSLSFKSVSSLFVYYGYYLSDMPLLCTPVLVNQFVDNLGRYLGKVFYKKSIGSSTLGFIIEDFILDSYKAYYTKSKRKILGRIMGNVTMNDVVNINDIDYNMQKCIKYLRSGVHDIELWEK